MQTKTRRTNRERTEETRGALIEAARRLFTDGSYAATSTPDIAQAAGVTRGALYHHFEDKQALLRAVVEEESAALARDIEQATLATAPVQEALRAGTDAYLEAMTTPGRTRLLLLDGPAVLGWAEMAAIDARHAGRTLRDVLEAARARGGLGDVPLEALTTVLSAAYDRAALALDAGGSRSEYRAAILALIEGLFR